MKGLVDIHAHFIYGVDDGAQSRKTMFAMLDMAHRQGISKLYATSHETPGVQPFDMDAYQAHMAEARAYCAEKGYEMELFTAAENLYTPAMDACIQEHHLITMGDSDLVLVEFVPDITPKEVRWALKLLDEQGYRTILAHIERYACMRGAFPFKLKKEFSVQYQINCRTVIARHRYWSVRRLLKWFRSGLIDYVSTDMHDTVSRPPRMEHAYEKLSRRFGQELADYVTRGEALTAR